ncbi:MAG: DUF177 domain-containing protein [candidate division WOR-3 bacterium]
MSNPHHPLRLNVGFLISAPIGTNRDFSFDYPTICLGGDLNMRRFVGVARFNRTPQGLLLQGEFAAETTLECVRCLEDFTQLLKWSFTDLYAFDSRSVSESNLFVPESGQIDLELLLREYAFLEFPISPLCKPDCRGLCPVCGENLNKVDCGHRSNLDSPFTVLKDLLR